MRVLSLFDGISCGQLALKRAGIHYSEYLASEIDKSAMVIAKKNFPNTNHIGDVTKVDFKKLGRIDLLLGGSPCQGFSVAGKGLNFKDPRSRLFFYYVKALRELKPKYFLLENVVMKKEWENVISKFVGVSPIPICSSLFSAQNRKRCYWGNFPLHPLPASSPAVLGDIMLDLNWYIGPHRSGRALAIKQAFLKRNLQEKNEKSFCLLARNRGPCSRGITWVYDALGAIRLLHPIEMERLQTLPDNYTNYKGATLSGRTRAIGNGWTVDVIAHILKGIKL